MKDEGPFQSMKGKSARGKKRQSEANLTETDKACDAALGLWGGGNADTMGDRARAFGKQDASSSNDKRIGRVGPSVARTGRIGGGRTAASEGEEGEE